MIYGVSVKQFFARTTWKLWTESMQKCDFELQCRTSVYDVIYTSTFPKIIEISQNVIYTSPKKIRRLRRPICEYFNVFRVTKLSETLLHHLVCRRRDFLWFLMQNNWIFYRNFVFPTAKAQNFRLRRTIFSSYTLVPKSKILKFFRNVIYTSRHIH